MGGVTNEFIKAVGEKINAGLPRAKRSFKCHLCLASTWDVRYVNMSVGDLNMPTTFIVGGEMMPLAVLTCTLCGHVEIFNLIVLGMVKQHGRAQAQTADIRTEA